MRKCLRVVDASVDEFIVAKQNYLSQSMLGDVDNEFLLLLRLKSVAE